MVLLLLVAVAVNTKLPGAATLVLASGLVRVEVTAAWAVPMKPSSKAVAWMSVRSVLCVMLVALISSPPQVGH